MNYGEKYEMFCASLKPQLGLKVMKDSFPSAHDATIIAFKDGSAMFYNGMFADGIQSPGPQHM